MYKRPKRGKGVNNKIKNAERIKINNIQFRSRLESFIYQKLLENNITDFEYEKLKFVLLEPFEYNNDSFEPFEKLDRKSRQKIKGFNEVNNKIRPITYLPDFTCINPVTKHGWLIEGKGFAKDGWVNKWKYFKKHLIDNGYNVSLYLPNTQQNVLKTIEDIKKKYYTD